MTLLGILLLLLPLRYIRRRAAAPTFIYFALLHQQGRAAGVGEETRTEIGEGRRVQTGGGAAELV